MKKSVLVAVVFAVTVPFSARPAAVASSDVRDQAEPGLRGAVELFRCDSFIRHVEILSRSLAAHLQ